jgi:type IV secretion system protein VirD4
MVAKLLSVGVALLVGLCIGTECFAYLARLAPELGPPLYRTGGVALYGPWMLGVWAWWWGWVIPRAFVQPGLAASGAALLVLVKTWPRPPQTTPVQAHWASKREMQQAECLGTTGIVLGKLR